MIMAFRIFDSVNKWYVSQSSVVIDGTGNSFMVNKKGKLDPINNNRYVIQRASNHKYIDGSTVYEGDVVYFSSYGKSNISYIRIDEYGNFVHKLDFYGIIGCQYYTMCIGNGEESISTIKSRASKMDNCALEVLGDRCNEHTISIEDSDKLHIYTMNTLKKIHEEMPKYA